MDSVATHTGLSAACTRTRRQYVSESSVLLDVGRGTRGLTIVQAEAVVVAGIARPLERTIVA